MKNHITRLLDNSLLKNTGIYTITNIINVSIPFFMLPILTRYLSPEGYGMVSMFTLLITLIAPFTGLNVHGAIARQYYNQEKVDIWSYTGNALGILLLSSSMVGVIFYIFAGLIANITSFPVQMLWTVVVFSFCQFVINIIMTIWQVQKKSIYYGFFNIFKSLSNIGLSIVLVISIGLGWQGRVYGQLIATIIFSGIAIYYLIKNKWVKFNINKEYIVNALRYGVPLVPHALSGSIISMTDRLFITNMVGLSATGVYTVGYQVGSIINILAMSFNNAYVPWLYERLKKNEYKTKVNIVKFTYIYFVSIILIAILLGMMAPYFLKLFLGKSFEESSVYVIWIALGYSFQGMYFMVVNYIFYAEKTKYLAMVTFITSIVNIVLNYYFIKIYGAIGAAQATTITYLFKFLFVWYLSHKSWEMPWNLKAIVK